MLNDDNLKDGKWIETDQKKIIDSKNIYHNFKAAHILYQNQQIKNLKSAVMIDTDNILELIKSPLYYISFDKINTLSIPSLSNVNDSFVRQNFDIFVPLTPEVLLDYQKYNSYSPYRLFNNPYTDKTNPLLSIVWNYLKTSSEYTYKPAHTKNLLNKFLQESCLSDEAKNNVRDTVVNIKLREENSLGTYKNILINGNKVLFNVLEGETDEDQKTIYNNFPKMIVDVEKGILNTLEQELETHIYGSILDIYNSNVREKLLTDFETYGYAAYYVEKINNKHTIINMPCGSFMYNKNNQHNVSFLCHSYFDEKDLIEYYNDETGKKIKSYFNIFIYNTNEECYDVFKITYTGELDNFISIAKKVLCDNEDNDKIKHEYLYSVKDIPITIKVNSVTALYGFAHNAQMFEKAIRVKIAGLELESLAVEQKYPVMLYDRDILNDSKKETKHKGAVQSTAYSSVNQDLTVSNNINNDIQGNDSELDGFRQPAGNIEYNPSVSDLPEKRKEDLMRPMPITLPNAHQHYLYQYQSNKQEMQNVGNGKYLQILQMHTQSGMTTTNATKSEQTAMIGMSASFNFFRDLLEKLVNVIWRDSVFEFIEIAREIYNKTGNQIINEKLNITESEKMLITMIASVLLDDKSISLDNKDNNYLKQFIKKMYIAYVYCFGHYTKCPKNLKELLNLFINAHQQISFVDAITVNDKSRYTYTRFLEDITDFMTLAQTAGWSGTEIDRDAIYKEGRKTSLGQRLLLSPEQKLQNEKKQQQDLTYEQRTQPEMMAMAQSKNENNFNEM